ncbi:N-acetylmuramoyl-L-alanine amidase [Roseibium marinum]|uniref:N-acetylmuramoyl-L-alanine amidase n=1 Tax=Roseibium marinum TaxID=281252 RepID=A0A2S3UJP4_9HYPH|nr:N-acetylmuramoyl-L-alanine amidase [Roseibium marinum]POF27926.1 N-acetylmuramoyl-L-alanine amidase [Roseibium marinum]
MADPKTYLFDLPGAKRPSKATIREEWYPGVKDYWDRSTSSRIFDAILGVRAVIIHATAGHNSSGAMSVMRDGRASWHWLVADEDEDAHGSHVWACAPEARAAWHVRNAVSDPRVNGGAKRVNHWSLGIEIVNSQKQSPLDPFSDWQVAETARIVRYCWAKYPNLSQVVSHALLDPSRRSDPGTHFPWDSFKALVLDGPAEKSVEELFPGVAALSELPSSRGIELCCTVT